MLPLKQNIRRTPKTGQGMIVRLLTLVCVLTFTVSANIIVNGGFETGDFTGWTVTTNDSSSAFGDWYVTNASNTPLNGFPTVGPATGMFYAVSDSQEGGTRTLTQSFTAPSGDAILSGNIFINDWVGGAGSAEVGILSGVPADPLTATPITIAYGPADTDVVGGFPNSYVAFSEDLNGLLTPGDTYTLLIRESDSAPFNAGVDDLSIEVSSAPEPGLGFLLAVGFAFTIYRARSRRNAQAV